MTGDQRDPLNIGARSSSGESLRTAVATAADVAALSEEERATLAHWLTGAMPRIDPNQVARTRRRVMLLVMTGAAIGLVPWLGVLSSTLPSRHDSDQWRLAWTGFDVALVLAFAATAWAGWRNRQVVITALVVLGTLLLCDAWFDVTLSWGTAEQNASILAAVVAEVPFALVSLFIAHRLLHEVTHYVWHLEGRADPVIPLYRVPLTFVRDPE
jgi:hypothetical protein